MSNTIDTDALPSEKSQIPQPEQEVAPVRYVDVHIYEEMPPDEQDTGSIETTLQEGACSSDKQTKPLQTRQKRSISPVWLILPAVFMLVVIVGSLVYPVVFAPSVTVTIIPKVTPLQTESIVTIVQNNADRTSNQINGQALPALTMSQSQSQATTGTTYQEARPGHGTLIFYNAALSSQTIEAGTLITGKDGIQVVTDVVVTVPAERLPTLGEAHVSAHTVQRGPAGNINARDIYGSCCLLNIQVANSAFTGGQDAQTYQSVAKQDIDTVVSRLQASLTQSALTALSAQLQSSETLVTPPTCETHSRSDHEVGDKATQVQVTVSQTCIGVAYDTQQFQQVVRQAQTQGADSERRAYSQLSGIQATVQKTAPASQPGTYQITVQSRGTWVYQFSAATLSHLAKSIAGKNIQQAIPFLLHTAGIQQVSFSASGSLPSDPQKIHFLFLVQQ